VSSSDQDLDVKILVRRSDGESIQIRNVEIDETKAIFERVAENSERPSIAVVRINLSHLLSRPGHHRHVIRLDCDGTRPVQLVVPVTLVIAEEGA
jgi:hypothetical protein